VLNEDKVEKITNKNLNSIAEHLIDTVKYASKTSMESYHDCNGRTIHYEEILKDFALIDDVADYLIKMLSEYFDITYEDLIEITKNKIEGEKNE